MHLRRSARLAATLLATPLLGGCGAVAYTPRPSPRIQVVPDGTSLVLVKNGRRYPFNMFGGSLEDVVQGSPRAEEEASSYRSKTVAGFVFSTIGTVSAGVGAGVLIGNEVRANPSSDLRIASLGMTFGGLALSIIGTLLVGSAQPHLWNAINLYNDSLPVPVWSPPPAYPGYPGYPGAPAYGPGPVPLSPAPVPLAPAPAPLAPVPAPLAPVPAPAAPPPPH